MKNAILVHGCCDKKEYFSDKYPSLSNSHWFPWLQKQLLMKGIFTQTPEMPKPYEPDYNEWKKEFERFDINEDTFLVGHSCGGGFLIRWLSENEIHVNKLILVAPWLDPNSRRTDNFFDFNIDEGILERVQEIHLLLSSDEEVGGVVESVEIIRKTLPKIIFHQFDHMGHFTYSKMKTEKFPELLDYI